MGLSCGWLGAVCTTRVAGSINPLSVCSRINRLVYVNTQHSGLSVVGPPSGGDGDLVAGIFNRARYVNNFMREIFSGWWLGWGLLACVPSPYYLAPTPTTKN